MKIYPFNNMSKKINTLWVEKHRPKNLDTYIGNEALVEDLKEWIVNQDFPNLLLHGGPGTGKTTAAKIITSNIDCDYLYLNCSDENGIDAIRDKVKQFASTATFKKLKVVILDEADFLTLNAQAALRNIIETFSLQTRFIFTCNFADRIISPLHSRLASYALNSLTPKQLYEHCLSILNQENVEYDKKEVVSIVKTFHPDIRKTLNNLQACVRNNVLIITGKSFTKSNYVQDIIDKLQTKDAFTEIRQIVADNGVKDFTEIYRALYDNTTNAKSIITIAEGVHNSMNSPDKEITFCATICKLLEK
jgi:DNA polymerase III delta prime subunit